jgi:uncharacterized protein YjbI with pentapeptide repeats
MVSRRTTIKNITISTLSSNVNYTNCTIINWKSVSNIIFDNCRFQNSNPIESITLRNIQFNSNCTFDMPEFQQCIFSDVKLFAIPNLKITHSQLSNCNLSNSNFTSLDLTGSFLTHCDFTNSDLSNAILIDVYARNNININLKLPSAWKVISNHWIGPQANLKDILLQNVSLDQMNLYATNLTNATLQNVSVQDTIFLNSIFQGLQTSLIKGTPAVLPYGGWIENNRILYKQDNIITLNPLTQILFQPKIISNPIVPLKTFNGDTNQNFIYCGLIENKIFGLSIPTYNSNNPLFTANKIHIYDSSTLSLFKKIEIPNFHIRTFQPQLLLGSGGFAIMGYGVNTGISSSQLNPNTNPVQTFTLLLDSSGNTNTLFETNGYKKIPSASDKLLGEVIPNFLMNKQKFYLSSLDTSNNSISRQWNIKCKQDCSGIDFSNKNLSYLDLSGVSFTNCNFTNTNFSYSDLTNALLIGCNFYQTNFTGANLTNVDLTGSTFYQPNFTQVKILVTNGTPVLGGGYKIINGLIFGPNMNLDGFDLSGLNLSNINLSGCSMRSTILTNTNISGTNFKDCILDNVVSGKIKGTPLRISPYKILNGFIVGPKVNLFSADLSGQDLSNLDLTEIKVNSQTNMFGCKWVKSITKNIIGIPILHPSNKMVNGNLLGAGVILSGQDLSNGDISGIDLSGADLSNVQFTNLRSSNINGIPILSSEYQIQNGFILGPKVNLSQRDLSGVLLNQISLRDCNLNQADLRFADLKFGISSGNIQGTPLLPTQWKLIQGYLVGPYADLSGQDLSYFDFSNTFLNQTNMTHTNLLLIRSKEITGIPILPEGYRILNGYIVGKQVDLSGANLSYQDLSQMDLFETNLSYADLNYANLKGCFLFQTKLEGIKFSNIMSGDLLGDPKSLPPNLSILRLFSNQKSSRYFVGPDMNLSNVEFRELDLTNLDLSGSILNNCYFNQCLVEQIIFTNADLNGVRSFQCSGQPIFPNSEWQMRNGFMIGPNANLMFQDFMNLDLSGTNLSNVNLNRVKYRMTKSGPFIGFPFMDDKYMIITLQNKNYIIGPNINLEGLDLSGVDLSLMNLSGTHIHQTDLKYTNLNRISSGLITGIPKSLPTNFRLEGGYLLGPNVNLSFANLERVDMNDMNFIGANFKGAKIRNSLMNRVQLDQVMSGEMVGVPFELDSKYRIVNGYFVGAHMNLQNTNLQSADLSNLNLIGTNFTGSNLSGVNFTDSDLSGAIFIGANLTDIIPVSILDTIDLTGAILPLKNYSQYNKVISEQLTRSELNTIYYMQVKERVFEKLFDQTQIKNNLLLSTIKQIHYPTYQKLFQLYTQLGNGLEFESNFDQLYLDEIDLRFQINAKLMTLIQNTDFTDEILCRLLNRMDIETIPERLIKILNVRLVSLPTLTQFYMKHMFNSKYHSYILGIHSILLPLIESFFRKWSKIYQNNHFVKKLYGVNNHYIHPEYKKIYQNYPKQMELFEMYMFSEDILNEFTNGLEVQEIFETMIEYNPNGFTPIVVELFTKIGTKIFSHPLIDNLILFKLNRKQNWISYSFEISMLKAFIQKNQSLVENVWNSNANLKMIWEEFNRKDTDIYVINQLLGFPCENKESAILPFRNILFYLVSQVSYSEVYPKDITETLLETKDGNIDSVIQLSDRNMKSISSYLSENVFVQRIIENPEEFINDLNSPSYSQVKDLSKFYGWKEYLDESTREKLIEMDIHKKLNENELKYIRLFSGTSSELTGEERWIVPLSEYQKVWKKIIS